MKCLQYSFLTSLHKPISMHKLSALTGEVKVTTVHTGLHLLISANSSRILEAEKVHH